MEEEEEEEYVPNPEIKIVTYEIVKTWKRGEEGRMPKGGVAKEETEKTKKIVGTKRWKEHVAPMLAREFDYLEWLKAPEPDSPRRTIFRSLLETKLASYREQDKKLGYTGSAPILEADEVIEDMIAAELRCYYCTKVVKLFHETKRDPEQWSLDRKNNYGAHTRANVVLACLSCNLRRRCQSMEKFSFAQRCLHVVIDTD